MFASHAFVCVLPFFNHCWTRPDSDIFLKYSCFSHLTFKPKHEPYMVGLCIITKEVKLNAFQFLVVCFRRRQARQGQFKGMRIGLKSVIKYNEIAVEWTKSN